MRVKAESLFASKPVRFIMQHRSANCLGRNHPPETGPWMITGPARTVGAFPNRAFPFPDLPGRGLTFRRFYAIASNEVFALVRHAMLCCDATSQGLDTFQVLIRNRLGMVDEPMQLV